MPRWIRVLTRVLTSVLLFGLLALVACAPAPDASAPPNLVLILADDLGRADVGFLAGTDATPSIDRIAAEGVSLEELYVSPVCSPTRAALLTGRSAARLGLLSVIRPWESRGLSPDVRTLAEFLSERGYATALVGKWHLGQARQAFWPQQRGFDHFYGSLGGAIDYFRHERRGGLDWQRNGRSLREEGYATDLLRDESVRWLRGLERDEPFFLMLSFNAPHPPRQAPAERIAEHPELPPERRVLAAMIDAMDDAIGVVLDELDRSGVSDRTLVVFLSDNGAGEVGRTGGLRGDKGSTYQGGIRVPAAIRFPGRLAAGDASRQRLRSEDLFATLLEAMGLGVPDDIDGESVWQELAGGASRERQAFLFAADSKEGRSRAVLDGHWKLVEQFDEGAGRWSSELFDIAVDPAESRDLAAVEPDVRAALEAQLEHWYDDELGHPQRLPAEAPADWMPPADWAQAADQAGVAAP